MKTLLTAVLCLLGTITSQAQTPPDTFSAGLHSDSIYKFYVGGGVQKPKVAIRLPESMAGQSILGINAWYAPERDPITPESWASTAVFTWTLNTGTLDQPSSTSDELVKVRLGADSSLLLGNWHSTSVEWPVLQGATYWLVGHWHDTADFIRLGRNKYCLDAPLAVGYKSGSNDEWQPYTSSGLMIQVTYGTPNQGIPSGIFDEEAETAASRGDHPVSAQITGGSLFVSFDRSNRSYSSYNLVVVNTLGQTVVNQSGFADFSELSIPWSAARASGVYFCRIQLGQTSYSVPVVNLK